jgi:hypothetical protein
MSTPQDLPGIESFRTRLKKGNMPHEYPVEALAQLDLDLRAAEAFVKTPEGARSLGLLELDRPSNTFDADRAWEGVPFEKRLALAESIGSYRIGHNPGEVGMRASKPDFPEVGGFNIGLNNLRHYPRQGLDELMADLQAAQVFISSKEGAEALGLKHPDTSAYQAGEYERQMGRQSLQRAGFRTAAIDAQKPPEPQPPTLWETLDLQQRLTVANSLAQRRSSGSGVVGASGVVATV